ncbi:uncharacterized protein LOC102810190 [Saccoglossus kowalevskii]
MYINMQLHNNSRTRISSVSLLLVQISSFTASPPGLSGAIAKGVFGRATQTRSCRQVMSRLEEEGCGARSSKSWVQKELKIPIACATTGLEGCAFIDVKYHVELQASFTGFCNPDLIMKCPVTLGVFNRHRRRHHHHHRHHNHHNASGGINSTANTTGTTVPTSEGLPADLSAMQSQIEQSLNLSAGDVLAIV